MKENYTKNLDILRENIKRGMQYEQVKSVIDSMEEQFKTAGLYNKEEKQFIADMREIAINSFSFLKIVQKHK